jgi:hypothetical protein
MNNLKQISVNAAVIVLLVWLTGCGVPSVHPLYEPEDLIINESLTGTWEKDDGKTTWEVASLAWLSEQWALDTDRHEDLEFLFELDSLGLGNGYIIQQRGNDDYVYVAGLVELGGNNYLDLYKLDFNTDVFSFPVHIFMKVSYNDDRIEMHMFSEEWLRELIRNRQVRIRYEESFMGEFLLTAPTRDLKKFVEKYGDVEEAYAHKETYRKISDTPRFLLED